MARIEANRRNAQLSTGPRTEDGRARARTNAVKHGLTAELPLLPGENRDDYDAVVEALTRELKPKGVLEEFLVARIGARILRLARVERIEAGILVWELYGDDIDAGRPDTMEDGSLGRLLRGFIPGLEPSPEVDERVRVAEIARSCSLARLGRAFIRDADGANALSKLSRYEARVERALARDVGELQRIKRTRLAEG